MKTIQMKKHSTFNIQRPTPESGGDLFPWAFKVECSRLNVPIRHFPLGALLALLLLTHEFSAVAQSTNGPANYSAFGKFISERNIFNPNRYAKAANTKYVPRTRTVRRNSFALAGTMSYDEGENPGLHAFFDGTSGDYRKALQVDGTIAVFKIAAITPESVTLVLDTNTTVLKIGQQMRDDGRGHWALATENISFAQNSSSGRHGNRGNRGQRGETSSETASDNSDTNAPDGQPMPDLGADQAEPVLDAAEPGADNTPTETLTLPSGPGSDALRRLMELRAQEEQQSGNRN